MADLFLQRARKLVADYIADLFDEGDPDKIVISLDLALEQASKLGPTQDKVSFLLAINVALDEYIAEHKPGCPHIQKGDPCPTEEGVDELKAEVARHASVLLKSMKPQSLEQKAKAICDELSKQPGRRGELREVLDALEISYIEADLPVYINFFRNNGYAEVVKYPKDKFSLTLTQLGLDFLHDPSTRATRYNIVINENYSNSVVAKGNTGSHVDLSRDRSPKIYPSEKPDPAMSKTESSQSKSEPGTTRRLQKLAIIVAVVLSFIGLLFSFLLKKGYI